MKKRFYMLLVAAALIATLAVPAMAVDLVTFTGNVVNDFVGPKVQTKVDDKDQQNIPAFNTNPPGSWDEPMGPTSFVAPPPKFSPSGFNVQAVYWAYDCTTDCLYIGLKLPDTRIAWDANDDGNILTKNQAPPFILADQFRDTDYEEYVLFFGVDQTDLNTFIEDFKVVLSDANGGIAPILSVTKNGIPYAGVTATWFTGPRVPPNYPGTEKDIEIKICGIRTAFPGGGGNKSLLLKTRSGGPGDLANEDITEQQMLLTCAPSIQVTKEVACTADGPFGPSVNVLPGTPVFYKVTVTNSGDEDLKTVSIHDVATSPGGACTGCIEIRDLPSNALLPCADIAVGNLAVGGSHSYLIKFGTDPNFSTKGTAIDCTNTATATGTGVRTGVVVNGGPASATVNVLVPSIICQTVVDDNVNFTHQSTTLNLPCTGDNIAQVYYKLCVTNDGEVPVNFGTGAGPCTNFVSSLLTSAFPGITGLPVDVCGLLRAQIPGGILAAGGTACITVGPLSFDKCALSKAHTPTIINNFTASGLAGNTGVCGTKQVTTTTCTTTVNVCAQPAITITKQVSCSPDTGFAATVNALRGAFVYFKVSVTNTGCDDLKDVLITDALTLNSAGSLLPCTSCADITAGLPGTSVPCFIPGTVAVGNLAVGATKTYECKVQTNPAFALIGTPIDATNNASVAGTGVTSGLSASAGPATATVNVLVPKIECTKYVTNTLNGQVPDFSGKLTDLHLDGPNCVPGTKSVFYQLGVSNTGEVPVDFTKGNCAAHFADTLLSQLPAGITISSPANLTTAFMSQLTNGVLAAGGTASVVVSTSFNELLLCPQKDWPNTFTACGFATGTGICLPDSGGENVSTAGCSASVQICCPCSIEITKQVSCSPDTGFASSVKALRGAPVYFKVCVKNSGSDTINDVTVTDTILSPDGAFLSCAGCTINGSPVTCVPGSITVGTLAPGEEKCIVCKVLTNPSFSTIGVNPDITNTASVSGTCATSQTVVNAGPVSATVDLLVPGITCDKLVDDDDNLDFDPADLTPPGHLLNAGDPANPVTNAYFKVCVINNGEVNVDFSSSTPCPIPFLDPKLSTLDALISGTGVDVNAALLAQLIGSVLPAGQTICKTFGPIVFDQSKLCGVINQWVNHFSACGIAKQADICLPDSGGENVDTGVCEAIVTLCPPTLKQVYCGLSCDPLNGINNGFGGIKGDAITAVPGIFAIDPGGPQWSNWVAAAKAVPSVPYTLTSVIFRKVAPKSVDCPDVFKGETKVMSGNNIQLWWPLMYELPGTVFTLTVNYDTLAPWDDGTGLKVHHTQTWSWSVKASLEDLRLLFALFHEVPLGSHQVPVISDETLYKVFLAQLDHIIDLVKTGQNGEAGLALDTLTLDVEDACITSFTPTKPIVTGPGTGIANTCENPACCKILADITWIQNTLGLVHP